jgi:cell wall-associated NlpC family hydrolase
MSSHRLKRTVRGALTASAVIVAVSTSTVPALAQPAAPTTESDAVKQYRDLNVEAEKLHQDFLQANEDKDGKQAELDKAAADLAAANKSEEEAKGKEQQFRGQVDDLSDAAFRGARFGKLSALLTGTSQRDFLDRSSALTVLAAENNKALAETSNAVKAASNAQQQATDAQHRATDARDAAARLTDEIAAKRKELDGRITTVKASLDKLSAADKMVLQGPPEATRPTAPVNPPASSPARPPARPSAGAPANPPAMAPMGVAGAAARAVTAALSRRGDTYVFGGSKPGAFDCSGLTMWSYAQAGITLPRTSRAQFGVGRSVSKDQLQPGDLLFYGSSAAAIHHVAMYIGNGNIVHASDFGIPVKSAPLSNGGRDYFGARRIVG